MLTCTGRLALAGSTAFPDRLIRFSASWAVAHALLSLIGLWLPFDILGTGASADPSDAGAVFVFALRVLIVSVMDGLLWGTVYAGICLLFGWARPESSLHPRTLSLRVGAIVWVIYILAVNPKDALFVFRLMELLPSAIPFFAAASVDGRALVSSRG